MEIPRDPVQARFRPALVPILVLLAAVVLLAGRAAARDPHGRNPRDGGPLPRDARRVVVVGVDGLRLQESYKWLEAMEPMHPAGNHTPRLASELIPEGTLFRNARNGASATVTTPCTSTIVTGAWHAGPNRGRGLDLELDDYVDNRSFVPTIFEHARRDLGLPPSRVVGITDKLNTYLADHSYHPGWGASYAPDWTELDPVFNTVEERGRETFLDPGYNSDLWVYERAIRALHTKQPDLLFVYFGLVDLAGHLAAHGDNFDFYARTIENFDRLVADLWREIQSTPPYAGSTTLILVSDHGRHDDHDPLAYTSHRGTCKGCRDLLLLVLGPRTPRGLVVDRRVWQTDVAPTVGAVMGFDMPYATGQPLFEALEPRPRARRVLASTDAVLAGDTVVAASRESLGTEHRITIRRAGIGEAFGPPRTVAAIEGDAFLDEPALLAGQDAVHLVYWRWTETNHAYVYRRSEDGGATFPEGVDPLLAGFPEEHPRGEVDLGPPVLLEAGGTERLLAPVVGYESVGSALLQLDYGAGGYLGLPHKILEDRISWVRREGHHRWLTAREGPDGHLYAAYAALLLPSDLDRSPLRSTWEVCVKDLSATTANPKLAVRVTDNDAQPDVMPALAFDPRPDGKGFVVFSGRTGDGTMQLLLSESADAAHRQWGEPIPLTASPAGAWEPSIAFEDGTLTIAYTDFATGRGDIRYLTVTQGVVSEPRTLAATEGISRHPRVLSRPGIPLVVVWEERSGGRFTLAQGEIPLE